MEYEPKLDDRYTEGIYYDAHAGEFCQIREWEDTIGLFLPDIDPENCVPYYTFDEEGYDMEDAIGKINADFHKVSDEAVENPAEVVERALRLISRNDPNELMGIPFQESIDLRYAYSRVQITEQ